jgi:hypothetical protein
MQAYRDMVHAAEMALMRRDGEGFSAAMDAAESSGMPRVDAMVLRLGAASALPTPEPVRRELAREYLKLAADAPAVSAEPSVHDALSVVMRVVDVCRERPALIADLSDEILAHLEQVPDDAPLSRDENGVVVERASTYKAAVHELIRQARRVMGVE